MLLKRTQIVLWADSLDIKIIKLRNVGQLFCKYGAQIGKIITFEECIYHKLSTA